MLGSTGARALALVLFAACFVDGCNGTPPPADGGGDGGPVCTTDAACDDGLYCNGVELCRPRAAEARANGCVVATSARCLTGQTCDEAHAICVTDCAVTRDADGDMHPARACGGDDCDDSDGRRFPGNPEICDEGNHDEDCNTMTFGDRDADHDGVPDMRCCNVRDDDHTMLNCGEDCNDIRRVVNPDTSEVCDHFDNDCDGAVDEGVVVVGFVDGDRDGYGTGPGVMVCAGTVGYALDGGDCDDANAAQRPMGAELCDGNDNDCDTRIDETPSAVTWYRDLDGDQYGSASSGTVVSCTPVEHYSLLGTDCDDHRAGINPGATEQCNGVDDDCNGVADHAIHPGDFEDDDGDGHVDAACGASMGDDCDDLDPATYPGAPEICDGRDNNCNGTGDDLTGMIAWYADVDGDGYGDSSRDPITSCVQPAGRVTRALDCDDSDPGRFPGNVDVCDGHDQDCDAAIDENAPTTLYWMNDTDADGYAGGTAVASCRPIVGALTLGGDCDDTRADRSPGATEACNGVDDDCDTTTDEGFGTTMCGVASCVRSVPACMAGAPTTCVPGTSSPESCNGLDDDCNGTVDDDPGATRACLLAHATSRCMAASCHVAACDAGYRDCNGAPSDGCEAALDTDPVNCGVCGHACIGGETCAGGHCASEVVDLTLGDHHSCALLGSGAVYCWGDNTRGQVGANNSAPYFATATRVTRCDGSGNCPALPGVIGFDAGHDTTCARRSDGYSASTRLVCWGDNTWHHTGDHDGFMYLYSGTYNTGNMALTIEQNVMGPTWQIVRTPTGLYMLGETHGGESGRGGDYFFDQYYNTVIPGAMTHPTELHCGDRTCYARDASSSTSTFGWGNNMFSQLPTAATTVVPPTAFDLGDWRFLVAGRAHTCLVREHTTDVVCFGDNSNGQLGAGDRSIHTTNVMTGTSGSIAIDAQTDTTCAINDVHEIVCWGFNDFGQCGTAGPLPVTVPSQVPRPGSIAARLIAVGGHHACAVLATNQVICWGQNASGQLGNGTRVDSVAPVFVSGLP